jgi:two-component system, cell cycle sensor histidine kinase and response regulator CckA
MTGSRRSRPRPSEPSPVIAADERGIDNVTAPAHGMSARSATQNAVEAQRRSEEQFRTIFDSMGDGVAISEPGGNYVEVNRVLCGRLGYSREELLTMPVSAINSPESAATVQGRVDEIMRGGGIRAIQATHIRRDGTELPIEAVSRLITFRGRPAILTVYRDITERKQADEALTASVDRLKIAMDAMLDGVSILSAVRDDSGRIVDFRIDYANAAIGVISRVAAEEQVGHTLLELFPAHRANGLLEAFIRVADTGVPFTSADFRYADPKAEGGPLDQILDQRVARLGDGCILSVRDVTEVQRVRDERERLAAIVEEAADGLLVTDAELRIAYVNPAFAEDLGRKPSDLVGLGVLEVAAGLLDATTMAALRDVLGSGKPWLGEADWRLPDGTGGRANLRITPRRAVDGTVLGHTVVARDVTEPQRIQRALELSELKYATAFRTSPDAVNINRLSDGLYLDISDGFTATTGFTRDDVEGKTSADIAIWVDARTREQLVAGLLADGVVHNLEMQFRRKDGSLGIGLMSGRVIDVSGEPCILSITRDITDRTEAEERFRTLFDVADDAIMMSEPGGKFIEVNRSACERLGYSRDELLTMSLADISAPGYAPLAPAGDEALKGARSAFFDTVHIRRNGTAIPVEISSTVIDLGGRKAVLSIARDIGERKRAEMELRASEERYRRITETITDFVFTVTVDHGRAGSTQYGPACVAVTGYTADEMSRDASLWMRMIVPEDRDAVLEQTRRIVAGDRVDPMEHRIVHKDGFIRWVRNTAVPQFGPDGAVVSYDGIIQDVTERRALREQLTQAQKMEAIGRLAGGVAHDFNNLLTAIRGFAELHLAEHAADDAGRADVLEIERAAERATQLTMRLLAFSRRAEVHPTPLDLAGLVRDAMALLRRLVGEDIVVHLDASPTAALVFADPVQMEQVLLNLAANARDAMPTGGTLGLEIKSVLLGDAYLATHPGAKKGWQVLLAVSDTGVGMDEATRAHIFEPFFTTKPLGEGTGLGLASVYGIVKQAGGYVDVESLPGGGSVFRVYLPVLEGATPQPRIKPAADQARRDGTETILLVEDESAVRLFAQRVLEDHGYRVLAFGDPGFALDAAMGDRGGFDALVTDVVMPTMSGPTLAERISVLRPGLPVLFMSAYGGGVIPAGAPTPLAKPFTGSDLADAVGALFGRTPSGGGRSEAPRS